MPDEPTQPLGNDPAARTPTGEIKTTPENTTTPDSTLPPKNDEKQDSTKAPEKYEPFKVPDGYTLDEKISTEAGTLFKELGLSQDAAQKLVDFYSKNSIDSNQAALDAVANQREEWRGEIVKDPKIGNGKDGLSDSANQAIGKFFESLDPKLVEPFKEAMNLTGAGDNPAFIKAIVRVGELLSEGKLVTGGGPAPTTKAAPRSMAATMFPNLPSSSR